MAWDCKSCGETVGEDCTGKCPKCGTEKAHWTLVGEKTRTFTVSRTRKLVALRGEDSQPGPGDASYEQVEVVQAQRAIAVPKASALDLAERGLLPPPEQVLFARLYPGTFEDLTVRLTVLHDAQEPVEHEFPGSLAESTAGELGHHDVRFLFVHGPEELPEDFGFPGLHVVEVGEETDLGFAPRVRVAGLGKRRKELPLEELTRRVDCLCCGQLTFHTDSALVLPAGLAVLTAALNHARSHPDAKLLIAGHTDAQGSDESNLELSRARAKSVLDVLAGDEAGWLEDVERSNSHLDQDVRVALQQVADLWGWPCAPSGVENDPLDAATQAAIGRFKRRFNAKFTTEHVGADDEAEEADEGFWRRVFNIYAHELAERLGVTPEEHTQLIDSLNWLDPEHRGVGFGEAYPLGGDDAADRRIAFLFVDPDDAPEKTGDDAEGSYLEALYDRAEYSFRALDCPEPSFYGEVAHNTVFVVDISGSMRPSKSDGAHAGRADRIGVAKRHLNRAILDLPAECKFSVIAYSDAVRLLWAQGGAPELRAAEPENKAAAAAWVNALGAHGVTRSSDALAAALAATGADEGLPKGIKFLSDGCPSPRDQPQSGTQASRKWQEDLRQSRSSYADKCREEEQQIVADVQANRGEWKVDTIAFLRDEAEAGPLVDFMRRLAEENDGVYTPVAIHPRKSEPEDVAPRGFLHAALLHPDGYRLAEVGLRWRRDGRPATEVEGVPLPDRIDDDGEISIGGLAWGTYTVTVIPGELDERGAFQEVALPLTRAYAARPHQQYVKFAGATR